MSEVVQFLKKCGVHFFATVGLDGRPKVRPFQFMLERDGRLYFCTGAQKDVYKQMEKQSYVEICSSSPEFAWIRLNGKAVFSNDIEIKKTILESNELVRSIYKTTDNPEFVLFYLDEAKAVIADFSGNPPKAFNL
jgi:uncharacterized pyridoxamine 5'-phosphate oxidase family protein